MGKPAAKSGDRIVAVDMHIVLIPAPPGPPVPTLLPHPYNGLLTQDLSTDVLINGLPAATVGSVSVATPPHIPQGGPFQKPPTNQGQVLLGSATVLINSKPAARAGDKAMTCNDPVDLPVGTVVSTTTTVLIGD